MKNGKLKGSILILLGVLGLALFVWVMLDYNQVSDSYFKKFEAGTIYHTRNVVSPWANFLFFTNQTLIIFSLWSILAGISKIVKNSEYSEIICNVNVVSFVFANCVITTLLYTIMEAFGPCEFGLYELSLEAWLNFIRNILIHYVLTIVMAVIFSKMKCSGRKDKKIIWFALTYFFSFYTIARLIGKFCFKYEWYPYLFFHSKSVWQALNLGPYNQVFAIILMILIIMAVVALYFGILFMLLRIKTKRSNI